MKTIRPLLISTLLAFGFASSAALAGEPNMAVFENDYPTVKTDKNNKSGSSMPMSSADCPNDFGVLSVFLGGSTAMSSGNCSPKSIHEKDAPHTGTQPTEQHAGMLKKARHQ